MTPAPAAGDDALWRHVYHRRVGPNASSVTKTSGAGVEPVQQAVLLRHMCEVWHGTSEAKGARLLQGRHKRVELGWCVLHEQQPRERGIEHRPAT
jgi:hypothetical protein